MKKVLIIIASVLVVGALGFLAFTLVSNNSSSTPNESSDPSVSTASSEKSLTDNTAALLALAPGASEALAEVKGECDADAKINARTAETPIGDASYDSFVAKANELVAGDEAVNIIEDNGDVAVNGNNLNLIYEDGNALLLNFKDGKLTVTQIAQC